MCYHVKSPTPRELTYFSEVTKLRLDFDPEIYTPYFHVSGFSHPMLPVVADNKISLMRWGLIPSWARTPEKAKEIQNRTLNCVGEEAFEKASFKHAIVKNRGALVVSGFYEWREFEKKKYPYFITGEGLLKMGCVFTKSADPDTGEMIQTFSIVTTQATPFMQQIHNKKMKLGYRMPLVLDNWERWIDQGLDRTEIESMMQPSTIQLNAHTISNRLNYFQRENTNTDDITDHVDYPELPKLSL